MYHRHIMLTCVQLHWKHRVLCPHGDLSYHVILIEGSQEGNKYGQQGGYSSGSWDVQATQSAGVGEPEKVLQSVRREQNQHMSWLHLFSNVASCSLNPAPVTPSLAFAKESDPPPRTRREFKSQGRCRFGSTCKFSHDTNAR